MISNFFGTSEKEIMGKWLAHPHSRVTHWWLGMHANSTQHNFDQTSSDSANWIFNWIRMILRRLNEFGAVYEFPFSYLERSKPKPNDVNHMYDSRSRTFCFVLLFVFSVWFNFSTRQITDFQFSKPKTCNEHVNNWWWCNA